MKLINAMQKPDLPGRLLLQPAALVALPNSVEVSDAFSVNGSGVGGGSNSIKIGLGEYFERRHFYREVLSRKLGFLSESLTPEEVEGFKGAFVQTCSKNISARTFEERKIYLSKVVRSWDFSTCFIPTVCISLSSVGLESDTYLYPLRDTCGCSFHWRTDVSFLGAIKEYLERQFLLKFWLTSACLSRVSKTQVLDLLMRRDARYLYSALVASGEVSAFDISDYKFPGACILVVYGQPREGHNVKYCAGMSYATDVASALEKSILELWQTYRFMDLFKTIDSDEERVEDSYLRYFLSCNSYETYQDVTDVQIDAKGQEKTSNVSFTLAGILSVLKGENISGYFYSKAAKVNGLDCVFSKYVSPDLFLHMNSAQNINLINKYSKGFECQMLSTRLKRMVPFP